MAGHVHRDKHEIHQRLALRLREHAEEVGRLTGGLDAKALERRTEAEKWSLKEIVCHLWRVQQVFEGRIDAMLSQVNPAIARYDPEGDPEYERMLSSHTAPQLIADFAAERERLAGRLGALSPAEWHRNGTHPQFPHYDVHFQVEYMVHHEAHHLYQLFQRRAALGKLPH